MQLTPVQIVAIWNSLNAIMEINDPHPSFTGYAKRICFVYLEKEIEIWNSLSVEERKAVMDTKLNIPITKLHVDSLPPYVPDEAYQALAPILEGEIPKPKPAQLAAALKKAKVKK